MGAGRLSRFVHGTVRQFGYEILPSRPGLDPWTDVVSIIGRGARVIIDVGANVGQTSDDLARRFPSATVHAIEPNATPFAELKRNTARHPAVICHQFAASDRDGSETFYVTRASEGSSLLPPLDGVESLSLGAWTNTDHVCVVQTRRLDAFASEQRIDAIDLLKSDTQGAELKVLAGAGDLLRPDRIRAVFCEVLFIPVYKQQSFFHDVYDVLTDRGYRLSGLYNEVRDAGGRLLWCDALFI